MCTGNSCRSIIAEALINKFLKNIKAYSCGTQPKKIVNPYAKKVLQNNQCWKDEYHPKDISKVISINFDLVITVCNSAKENCPIFPKPIKQIHIPFDDPDGKEFIYFEKTFMDIKNKLLPEIEKYFFK